MVRVRSIRHGRESRFGFVRTFTTEFESMSTKDSRQQTSLKPVRRKGFALLPLLLSFTDLTSTLITHHDKCHNIDDHANNERIRSLSMRD